MLDRTNIITLRMNRQHLIRKAKKSEYNALYRDLQPGQNVYWNGFGDPPSLKYRADFDDIEYNRELQSKHELLKLRLMGGNLGWIVPEDLELFAALYRKPLDKPNQTQLQLLALIERGEPMNIRQMKNETGLLVKAITPALHRLQKAFLIYEDQYDSDWDRGWYPFTQMFPDADFGRYTRHEALKIILQRFAYRHVLFDMDMAQSFYKLSAKDIKAAIVELIADGVLIENDDGYMLTADLNLQQASKITKTVFAMHRSDFLVKSNEYWLKDKWPHSYPDTLYYLLVDGEFRGAVVGKFRYTPEFEDVLLDLPQEEAASRKEEVFEAIHEICSWAKPPKRYQGEAI